MSLGLLALFSATFLQGKSNNNGSFFTRLSFLLLGENTEEQGSEDCRGRKPELAGSPGLRAKDFTSINWI